MKIFVVLLLLLVLPMLMADTWRYPFRLCPDMIKTKTQIVSQVFKKSLTNNITCLGELASKNDRLEIKYLKTMDHAKFISLAFFEQEIGCTLFEPCTGKETSLDSVCGACGDPGLLQVVVNLSQISGYSCSFPATDYIFILKDEATEGTAKPRTLTTPNPPSTPTHQVSPTATAAENPKKPATPTDDSPTMEEIKKRLGALTASTAVLAVVTGTALVAAVVKGALMYTRYPRCNNECMINLLKICRPKVDIKIEVTSPNEKDSSKERRQRTIDEQKIEDVIEMIGEIIDL